MRVLPKKKTMKAKVKLKGTTPTGRTLQQIAVDTKSQRLVDFLYSIVDIW